MFKHTIEMILDLFLAIYALTFFTLITSLFVKSCANPLEGEDDDEVEESVERSKKILDHGFVELIDTFPADELEKRIVESARVSYNSESKTPEQDKALLRYLWRHKHMSPFETVQLLFRIRVPLFVRTHLLRHRTAKVNEVSARYTVVKDERYIPELRFEDRQNKQGSVTEAENEEMKAQAELTFRSANLALDDLYSLYESLLSLGVAREVARGILPENMYTTLQFSIDLRNFLNFYFLRSDQTAQWETRQVANAMWTLVRPLIPTLAEVVEQERGGLSLDQEELEAYIKGEDVSGAPSRKREFHKKVQRLIKH